MKIGEFSKAVDISQSTVRYYIKVGLLTPATKGDRLHFSEHDIEDMRLLNFYRDLEFTLADIRKLLFLKKAAHLRNENSREDYTRILEDKLSWMEIRKENLLEKIELVENELNIVSERAPTEEMSMNGSYGIPLGFLDYLACPHCEKPIALKNTTILDGYVREGILECACGFEASIANGIICTKTAIERSRLKSFDSDDMVKCMIRELGPSYQELIEIAWQRIYQRLIAGATKKRVLLVGPMMNNFVHLYADRLVEYFTIVVIDPAITKLMNTREWTRNYQDNIILIAGDIGDWPLQKGIADAYVDDFCSNDSLFAYDQIFCDAIVPLLKKNAQVYGVLPNYVDCPLTCQEFQKDHPETDMKKHDINYVKAQWENSGVVFDETRFIGRSLPEEQSCRQNVKQESFRFFSWYAHRA